MIAVAPRVTAAPRTPAEKRRRWIVALIAVLGLAAVLAAQLVPVRHRVEADLTQRSAEALTAAAQPVSRLSFRGRDALVVTASDADAARAREVVGAVDGVRVVRTRVVAVAPVLSPPTVLVSATAGTAALTGSVPTTAIRSALHDAVTTVFGPDSVDDRITVADTVAGDPALTALPALLRAVPREATGLSVRLAGGAVTLTGVAPAETARTTLARAVRTSGLTVDDRVTVAALQPQIDEIPALTFRTGSATLTGESRAALRRVAALLEANPSAAIRIAGHTDSSGSRATNLYMSRARADAVRTALRDQDVAADRLTVVGYGEAHPVAPNDTPAHRAMNRRVELTVTSTTPR
ncbi:OmpA family protein [Actinoplanes sp. NPDC051851]|uniref:OmpA family protein n=1 Tax=Actinoplanes sp. NPDC051851 TaxID=3154753 RepID=UPI0034246B0E